MEFNYQQTKQRTIKEFKSIISGESIKVFDQILSEFESKDEKRRLSNSNSHQKGTDLLKSFYYVSEFVDFMRKYQNHKAFSSNSEILEFLRDYKNEALEKLAKKLSFNRRQFLKSILPLIKLEIDSYSTHKDDLSLNKSINTTFVSPDRIKDLKDIKSEVFDYRKLIRFCEELNDAMNNEMYYSIAFLVQSIMDHIPPLFNFDTFVQFSSNYTGATSFVKSMKHMQQSLRNIADQHLHLKIRKKETLPTFIQVDCRRELDLLLAEIIRIGGTTQTEYTS